MNKYNFLHFLVAATLFVCSNASIISGIREITKTLTQLTEILKTSLNDEYFTKPLVDGSLSEGRLLLVAIKDGETTEMLPMLGNYKTEKKCGALSALFYEYGSNLFHRLSINCNDKVTILVSDGFYQVSNKGPTKTKKVRAGSMSLTSEINLSTFVATYLHKDLPECPAQLKDFNPNMFPANFDVTTDQKYTPVDPQDASSVAFYGFYSTTSKKTREQDNKNELTYAVFETKKTSYAVPILEKCQCSVVSESNLLDCQCVENKYQYQVSSGILTVNGVQLLTNNVGGFKVLTSRSLQELLVLVDIVVQETENSKKGASQTPSVEGVWSHFVEETNKE